MAKVGKSGAENRRENGESGRNTTAKWEDNTAEHGRAFFHGNAAERERELGKSLKCES